MKSGDMVTPTYPPIYADIPKGSLGIVLEVDGANVPSVKVAFPDFVEWIHPAHLTIVSPHEEG